MHDRLIGKRVLVDVVEYDRDLNVRLRADYAGVIVAASADMVRIRRDDTGEVVGLRAALDAFEPAPLGDDRLRSGAPVAPPDLVARWEYYDELPGYGRVVAEYDTGQDGAC